MGRHAKFSFPIPGRSHQIREQDAVSVTSTKKSGRGGKGLTKAQRVLGTDNDLNIDNPIRVDDSTWGKYAGSRISGMSICISESTQSADDIGSIQDHHIDHWDSESEAVPGMLHLHENFEKASSTLLGQRHGELGEASSLGGRLKNEDSSSTLKSYYDRQKSPLSISQQTSASSARDLALRKGYTPVVPRSPLLHADSVFDSCGLHHQASNEHTPDSGIDVSYDKAHKKPSRLDLSLLFPRSKKSALTPSPSSASTSGSRGTFATGDLGRRTLKKSQSKESLQTRNHSLPPAAAHDSRLRQANSPQYQKYDHFEPMPVQPPHMDCIPESRVYESNPTFTKPEISSSKLNYLSNTDRESYSTAPEQQPFSWKNVRASMVSQAVEASSAASISSRKTKSSKHTNASHLSNSDLLQKSVLSLSSDSDDDFHEEPDQAPLSSKQSSSSAKSNDEKLSERREGEQQLHLLQQPANPNSKSHRKKASQYTLEVPTRSSSNSLMSHTQVGTSTVTQPRAESRTSQKDKRSSRTSSSVKSGQSSHMEPTPPLSPTSIEFMPTSDRISRFMAVTHQEEALLEALRRKRAHMREEIISEHEITKAPSPPSIPARHVSRVSRSSNTPSLATIRGGDRRVLMHPSSPEQTDIAEPSPDDLSDLASLSEENSTARTSRPKTQARSGSAIRPRAQYDRLSPITPPSTAARLSAVGGYSTERTGSKKRTSTVRFIDHPIDDSRLIDAQDFLLDENEGEVLWRL